MTSPAERLSLGPRSRAVEPALDDDLALGDRRVRRHVGGQLGRLELFEVAAPAPGPTLRRAATTAETGGTATAGRATGTDRATGS